MTDTDREAFEAWAKSVGGQHFWYPDWEGAFSKSSWEAYQAATQRYQSRIAELEADAALGRQMREAIGNESLARFIEKHGEPVPIMKRVAELEAEVQALRKDAERMDWMEKNLFSREPSDWDSKHGVCKDGKNWAWGIFAPSGVQGSARRIIDAAMNKEGAGE